MRGHIKTVQFNNRSRILKCLYSSGKCVEVHYGQLGIKHKILDAWADKETHSRTIVVKLVNGHVDYIPWDQPLFLARDPEELLHNHIERIIAVIIETLHKKKISKHYLAQALSTSDNQIQRLLNPAILNKNLHQLYVLADLIELDLELNICRRKAA
jgi:hypothetical protein